MGTENIHVSVENDKRLNLNVNIGQGDEIKVPVTIGGGGGGSCDIDTTSLAKQGDDQKATNTAIYNAVQSKLTPLEAVLTELNNGKEEIVDAIVSKGVYASTDNTLNELADIIRSIKYEGFDTSGVEFINGLIPKSLSELLANKDGIIKMEDNSTTALTVEGGLSGLQNLEVVSLQSCEIVENLQFQNCPKLEKVSLPKVEKVRNEIFKGNTALREVDLRGLTIITKISYEPFIKNCPNLSKLDLSSLSITHSSILQGQHNIPHIKLPCLRKMEWCSESGAGMNYEGFTGDYIQTLELPVLESNSGDNYNNIVISNSIKRLQVGKTAYINTVGANLIDIEIADGADYNITFRWDPSAVYGNEEKVNTLNENIRNHIIAKLKDLTGSTPKTVTFYVSVSTTPNVDFVNVLSDETMDAFAAKNWNVSPAKTV